MPYKDILKNKFNELKTKKKCGLISFITAGDPDFNTSFQILEKLPDCGVDIIELGMPFLIQWLMVLLFKELMVEQSKIK